MQMNFDEFMEKSGEKKILMFYQNDGLHKQQSNIEKKKKKDLFFCKEKVHIRN